MKADELRAAAKTIREALSSPGAVQIEERGVRLATLPRGTREELRINWDEGGRGGPALTLRVWSQSVKGYVYPDPRRGLSVRLSELPQLVEAIALAAQIAAAQRPTKSITDDEQANAGSGPGRESLSEALLPAAGEHDGRHRRSKGGRRSRA